MSSYGIAEIENVNYASGDIFNFSSDTRKSYCLCMTSMPLNCLLFVSTSSAQMAKEKVQDDREVVNGAGDTLMQVSHQNTNNICQN